MNLAGTCDAMGGQTRAGRFGVVFPSPRVLAPAPALLARPPAGTGLGAFNDRLRDGAMGGGPFAPPQFQVGPRATTEARSSCHAAAWNPSPLTPLPPARSPRRRFPRTPPAPVPVRTLCAPCCPFPADQGLVTGLLLAPNPASAHSGPGGQGGPEAQRAELLVLSDWARSALAGNLRHVRMRAMHAPGSESVAAALFRVSVCCRELRCGPARRSRPYRARGCARRSYPLPLCDGSTRRGDQVRCGAGRAAAAAAQLVCSKKDESVLSS
jgi:hypothetical protein